MQFKKIYEIAYLYDNSIVLDSKEYGAIEGKHCIWIPDLELKIPWTFNGKIEARQDWDKGRNRDDLMNQVFNDDSRGWDVESLDSINNEYHIFRLLAKENMSPPVDGFVYIKNMISKYIRQVHHCDPIGVIGFNMKNADLLAPGKYDFDKFKEIFIDERQILCSNGALGDFQKQDNVINGYLVDVRRTIWDMAKSGYDFVDQIIWYDMIPDKEELKTKILSLGQFPYGQRKRAYQTYWLGQYYEDGTRQTLYRFDQMKIDKDLTGKVVVDLGSQLGSMVTECYLRGARHITGIEYEKDYVDCARDLARYNHHQINYQHMNLEHVGMVVQYLIDYYQNLPIDIIFLLSMYKHIGNIGFKILYRLNQSDNTYWKAAYIESNNCPDHYQSKQAQEIERNLNRYFPDCEIERIGLTEDRSPRCMWKVEKT